MTFLPRTHISLINDSTIPPLLSRSRSKSCVPNKLTNSICKAYDWPFILLTFLKARKNGMLTISILFQGRAKEVPSSDQEDQSWEDVLPGKLVLYVNWILPTQVNFWMAISFRVLFYLEKTSLKKKYSKWLKITHSKQFAIAINWLIE